MATNDDRRAYYREWYRRTHARRLEVQRESRRRLTCDPMNRRMSMAIKDYVEEDGLTARGLAKRIGSSERMVYQYLSACSRIDPERFRLLPELYEALVKIKEEYTDERSSRD